MLTDEELDEACAILIEHEGLVPWLYCDLRGFVTVGVGDKVTPASVLTTPLTHLVDGSPANSEEKASAFIRVQNFFTKGLTAQAYRAVSDLRLDYVFCRRRLACRVKNEFVPAIEKQCPQFAVFPVEAKLVLVDIAYNVGIAGFATFVQLIEDCNSLQFGAAAQQVHTAKEGEDPRNPETWGARNMWRHDTMLSASRVS
jgi:GH24 family phage-related lysozyme (muramidase)